MVKPAPSQPRVSFVIPTLNAGWILDRCLSMIRDQDYPPDRVEIVIVDAYSTDNTRQIARKYRAKIIDNPKILHEPGKTIGAGQATGEIIFYTDADNIPTDRQWLKHMVKPYQDNQEVVGFLPQTWPPPDSPAINRYLSYLFTDPLTWFIYGRAANPADYQTIYQPIKAASGYQLYQFTVDQHPLFGLSQGVGVNSHWRRGGLGEADDILSGIQIIQANSLIAYIPAAKIYHYHVNSWQNFLAKYRWRVRNNLIQRVKGMGIANRQAFLNLSRRLRIALFIPYSVSLILPLLDSIRLIWRWRDPVMLWHLPACLGLSWVILTELALSFLGLNKIVGRYGQ